MTEPGARRAGWYADPLGEAELRWWDSQRWTTEVTTSRSKSARPASAPRPTDLQWAEDDVPENRPASSIRMPAPPTPPRAAEPSLVLEGTPKKGSAEADADARMRPDWGPLALALLNAGDNIVIASAAGIPNLTIDMVDRTYWWLAELDSFPAYPEDLVVRTIPRVDAPKPTVAGRYMEPLLWRIGTGAHRLFKRVDPTLRYKLRRWPDLGGMPHTAEQLRAVKLLATAQLTPAELAAIADIPEADVRTLVGTFGLMSLLDTVKDPASVD